VSCSTASIAGWKAINESDMLLAPDCDTAVLDLRGADLLIVFCDVMTADRPALCPRPALDREEGRELSEVERRRDNRLFRPRGRVLHLRRRALRVDDELGRLLDRFRGALGHQKQYPDGNTGHRPPSRALFPVPPVDGQSDLPAEMLSFFFMFTLASGQKHHHGGPPSRARQTIRYARKMADGMQIPIRRA